MLFDLTLLCCSYETPQIIQLMFQSFVYHHPDTKIPLIVMENSKSDETEQILKKNNIFYHRTPGATHSPSVSLGLESVKTKYCLLVDSDILFLKPVDALMRMFVENNLALMGEMQESRGGYNLHPRISPHACFIDMEKIDRYGIKYHDQTRIDSTQSNGFFGNIPLQKNGGEKYYDVGSTFLEDIRTNNLKIAKINSKLTEYVFHAESGSWATKSGIPGYIELGKQRENRFFERAKMYENVSIENKFS